MAVQLVGQAARVETCVVVVTMTCGCRPDNRVLTIAGVQNQVRCAHCGAQWIIASVGYDRRVSTTGLAVGVLRLLDGTSVVGAGLVGGDS